LFSCRAFAPHPAGQFASGNRQLHGRDHGWMQAGAALATGASRRKGVKARNGRSGVPPYMPLRLAVDGVKQRRGSVSCQIKHQPREGPS
jgi:hypothetical protein